jgi:asparaginyl-tRNA synthetase
MNQIVYIEDIARHVGEPIRLRGWLHNRRSSGKIHFLTLRDGTRFIQCVMSKKAVGDEMFTRADHLSQESAIIVEGTARADTRAPGGYEVDVTSLEIVSEAKDYPITPKEHGVDYLMDRRHLWIRSQRQQAIPARAPRGDQRGARLLQRPRLHPRRHADLHAGGVRRHDDAVPGAVLRGHDGLPDAERAALQRGQRDGARPGLLLRADVPRRESPKTRPHLTEFWMVEPEIGLRDARRPSSSSPRAGRLGRRARARRSAPELKARARHVEARSVRRRSRASPTTRRRISRRRGCRSNGAATSAPRRDGCSRRSSTAALGCIAIPGVKAFYMKPDPDRPRSRSASTCCRRGYGEIIGGGERLADFDLLLQRIKEHNLPQEAFEWYLDLRRYGTVPHGGFGMGIERVVSWICGLEHLREAIPYPRMLYRMYP